MFKTLLIVVILALVAPLDAISDRARAKRAARRAERERKRLEEESGPVKW
jgi:hypothetical protein